jgi:HTH-type transcriptional regulator / antitoxin HigA
MTTMDISPIRDNASYKAALQEVSAYFDNEPEPGSAEGDRFEILLTLVEAYEARNFPIESADPIAAIKFRMEQGSLEIQDLVPSIGRKNRVYEVLAGSRPLTIDMIRNLHRNLGIPAESLIGVSKKPPKVVTQSH